MRKEPSRAVIARRKNASARRTRVLEEGGRRIELLLLPDAAKALTTLERESGEPATTVISGLLLQAANRRR